MAPALPVRTVTTSCPYPMEDTTVIQARHLTRRYAATLAVDDLSAPTPQLLASQHPS